MDPAAPSSPCINVCSLDGRGLCRGCYRTLAEISGWAAMPAGQKHEVLRAVAVRRQADRITGEQA